jgi:Flp pilus assembly protein TadG
MIDTQRRIARRRGERGQVVPLMALFAVVLLGCTAIATDLSVSTHYKRNLQNVTDAAALAGAKQLPVTASASKQESATETALKVLHNAFPWTLGGATTPAALATSGCNGAALQCSVNVCAGLTLSGCTNVPPGSNEPFSITVNTPPKSALNAIFNRSDLSQDPNYYQRVEVIMHQQSGGFFSGVFGVGSEIAGAQSVAWHFASGTAFPFALFSRTVVQDGNSPELIAGNIYAARYVAPQGNGQAAVCAEADPNGNPGFIVLGAPQAGDSGYANDGQHGNPKVPPSSDPILDGVNCSSIGAGTVGMSANPGNNAGCAAGFGGALIGTAITFNGIDDACEATPALGVPAVAALPNIPGYSSTQCASNPPSGSTINPWANAAAAPNSDAVAFQCNGNNKPSLNISGSIALTPGIYEILPSGNAPCDVTVDGTGPSLTGVTFFLRNGAGICVNPPSGVTVYQTPYCGTCSPGPATPGDGVYDVLSDNVGNNPSITMNGSGGGSTSGIWHLTGVIWLPTGTATINNKNAIEDTGQILVNTWNDQSGNHQNPSVTYSGPNASPQQEELKLVE